VVDVYLAGVGGQGIITAARIIGDAAVSEGKKVLLSETHGMAQRGGSVFCTARIGSVESPLIADGEADAILSFELLETLKAIRKASKKTVVIASTERIIPLSVSTQKMRYPSMEEVASQIRGISSKFVPLDSRGLAVEAGVPMSSNIVMIGALAGSGITGLKRGSYEAAVGANIRVSREANLDAFSRGFDAARADH